MIDDEQIRVALVEDHPSSAEGLVMRFISEGFTVLANVTTPADLAGLRPDVVVCDLHLADKTPPHATITAVRDQGLRVLAVSGPPLREEILDAIGAGTQGFVDKQEPTRITCLAAAEIANGGGWIGAKLAGYLVHDALVRPLPTHDLTATDLDVLRTLAQGHSREETASRLELDLTELRTIHLRILDTECRRRTRLRPTERQQEVMIKIGVEELSHRRAARQLKISGLTPAYPPRRSRRHPTRHRRPPARRRTRPPVSSDSSRTRQDGAALMDLLAVSSLGLYGDRESHKWEPTQSAALRLSPTTSECSPRSRAPRSTQSDGDRLRKPP
jgi:DNA-binding NarL/FixJ family response regulator